MHLFVAVKDESGQYLLDGYSVAESGQTEIVRVMAGSKFKYKIIDGGRDYLYSLGPLQDSLIIQVLVCNLFVNIMFLVDPITVLFIVCCML